MIFVTGHNFGFIDTDSIVSSIVLSEILNQSGYKAKPIIMNSKGIQDTTLKIINKIGNINIPENISKKEIENNEIALVDHNNPMESYGKLGIKKTPVLCIDHHNDINGEISHKIIKRVGSTCTILTQLIESKKMTIPNYMARALVYAIACDTKGLKSRKKCKEDEEAIEYLYDNYEIGDSLKNIAEDVMINTDILNLTSNQILNNSLKEYCNGQVGIATLEVLNDDYKVRLKEILTAAETTKYALYVLIIFKQHTGETIVYYFNKTSQIFPKETHYPMLISRSQDIVPNICKKIGA